MIGGLLGGLAGAGVAKNDAIGAVLGAAVGAAAGSWVGCSMGSQDRVSLEDATRRALNENRSTTWTNPQTGASARINVYADSSSPSYSTAYSPSYGAYNGYASTPTYGQWLSRDQLRFGSRVSAASAFETVAPRQEVISQTYLRTSPSTRAATNGTLYRGQEVQVLGKVRGSSWLLVGRNGEGVGYVPQSSLSAFTETQTSAEYAAPISTSSIRLNNGVRWAAAYESAPSLYRVASDSWLRAEPSMQSQALGNIYRGDEVQALARVRGSSWVLLGRNGYGIGYAPETALQPLTAAPTYTTASSSGDCRIVEQEISTSSYYGAQTQRYRACRDYRGDWSLTAL